MVEKFAAVGWQGITIDAPDDWSLVGVNGDGRKGMFQVDSPIASAIQVKWERAAGKKPELMVKARELLAAIEKTAKKAKVKFSSDLKPDKNNSNSVGFSWRTDRIGNGRILYCEKCDRVMVIQIISTRDENVSHLMPVILNSIRDHREDGWTAWAMYGLSFAVPPNYKLEKQTLMSGYLSLSFKNGAKTLVVDRWALAATLLASDSIEQWYRKDAVPDIRGFKVAFKPMTVAGHEGVKVEGRRSGIKQALKAIAHSFTLYPHPGLLTGYVWHCIESNRLFSVRSTHIQNEEVAEKVRDLIVCHTNKGNK